MRSDRGRGTGSAQIHRICFRAAAVVWVVMMTAIPAMAQTFSIGTNFTGVDRAQQIVTSGGSSSIPPDTMGAVGPSHIAVIINGHFAVSDKSGVNQLRTTLNGFWNSAFANSGVGTTANGSFDPRILYDPHSSRWYATAVDTRDHANSRVLVGVTTGSDPSLANWHGFVIDADSAGTRWADFPTVGLDATDFYISNNMFDNAGGASLSATVTLMGIPKSSLTAATPSITGYRKEENIDPNLTGYAFQPAVDMDNGASPLPGVADFNSTYRKRTTIAANWITGGSNIPAQAFPADFVSQPIVSIYGNDASQPGTNDNILMNDSRFSGNAVLQNGSLWAVHAVDIGDRGAVRWYEFDPGASQFAIKQTGLITDPSLDLYFPSIAVNDSGDAVIGFSGSDDSTYASAYVVVGETTAGVTTFSSITQTKAGQDEYYLTFGGTRNRWGDYSATVVDPTNDSVFWTFQEFVEVDRDADGLGGFSIKDNNWGIQVTQIITPEPAAISLLAVGGLALVRRRRRA